MPLEHSGRFEIRYCVIQPRDLKGFMSEAKQSDVRIVVVVLADSKLYDEVKYAGKCYNIIIFLMI